MHVVDDGSTDNTEAIIKSYLPLFEHRGYVIHYHFQENQGQSVAINNGLKLIKGDYLIWPDADDFFKTNDAVECLVESLERKDSDYAMARCMIEYLDQENLKVIDQIDINQKYNEELFEDCLYAMNGFWFCPGDYIVRTSALRMQIPGLEIFTDKNAGQNWQLMLTVLDKYKCVTIPQIKYYVLSRKESHSRGHFVGRKATNSKLRSYRNTIIATLDAIPSMTDVERNNYKKNISRKYKKLIIKNNFIYLVGRPIRVLLKSFFSHLKK